MIESMLYGDLFQEVCKYKKKWGLNISIPYDENEFWLRTDFYSEIKRACPILDDPLYEKMLYDSGGVFFFDSREEMEEIYDQIKGDDGPTRSNPYDGPARVYALTCDPDGQLLNENT